MRATHPADLRGAQRDQEGRSTLGGHSSLASTRVCWAPTIHARSATLAGACAAQPIRLRSRTKPEPRSSPLLLSAYLTAIHPPALSAHVANATAHAAGDAATKRSRGSERPARQPVCPWRSSPPPPPSAFRLSRVPVAAASSLRSTSLFLAAPTLSQKRLRLLPVDSSPRVALSSCDAVGSSAAPVLLPLRSSTH